MTKIATQPLFQAFNYNFASDKTDGAIGTINTGVQLPVGAQIIDFTIFTIIGVTSGGAATLNFGTTTTAGLLTTAHPYGKAAFVANTWVTNFASSITNALGFGVMDKTLNIIMTIGTAQLTAGNFNGYIYYLLPE